MCFFLLLHLVRNLYCWLLFNRWKKKAKCIQRIFFMLMYWTYQSGKETMVRHKSNTMPWINNVFLPLFLEFDVLNDFTAINRQKEVNYVKSQFFLRHVVGLDNFRKSTLQWNFSSQNSSTLKFFHYKCLFSQYEFDRILFQTKENFKRQIFLISE